MANEVKEILSFGITLKERQITLSVAHFGGQWQLKAKNKQIKKSFFFNTIDIGTVRKITELFCFQLNQGKHLKKVLCESDLALRSQNGHQKVFNILQSSREIYIYMRALKYLYQSCSHL